MDADKTVAEMTILARCTWTKYEDIWAAQTRRHDLQPGDLVSVVRKDKTAEIKRLVRPLIDYGTDDVVIWEVAS